ncbi:uncharacterized protein [Antedon mediterranea]|uniref:uncharacterized protein n=1 Tax=Antedon mediterranea TaxID=105859 RepID=UPI003AF62D19
MDDHSYSKAHSRSKSILFTAQVFGEAIPDEGSPQFLNPEKHIGLRQVNECCIIKCAEKEHCEGWHCPLCNMTRSRYRMRNHFFTVHWASRVTIGEINSLLCKCEIPNVTTPRHWHCPFCNTKPYFKLKYLVFHIGRVHKPNKTVQGYTQRKLAYTVDSTTNADETSADTTTNDNTLDVKNIRLLTWTPNSKDTKDISFLGSHGCKLIRCTDPGHCAGWHCSLCPHATQKHRVRRHLLSTHWACRIEVGDKVAVMCKCDQISRSGLRHWHCHFCNKKISRPKKLILHLMNVHKPDELVKRYSMGKLHSSFNTSGIVTVPQAVDDKQEFPIQVPSFDCEIIKCLESGHCKGWHCPLCTVNGRKYYINTHLQTVHFGSRLEFEDKVSVMCKCGSNGKKTPRHWHCPLCTNTPYVKSKMLMNHVLSVHKPQTTVRRYCQGKLVTVINQGEKPDPPKRKKEKPNLTESLLYNGSTIDIIPCELDVHCEGWHCPLCDKAARKYIIKRHLYAVHWSSRVQVGDMKALLCKCLMTKLKASRHFHCPLCENVVYSKSLQLQKHILREHSPTADVYQYFKDQAISILKGIPQRESLLMMDEDEDIQTVDTTMETTELAEATEILQTTEPTTSEPITTIVRKDQDCQNVWDMVKCAETEHCEGWHCTLCTMTGNMPKLKKHFRINHRSSRIEVGGMAIIACMCRKVSGLGHQHWHCPLCVNRSFSRILSLEDHFVATHKPIAEVKRFARGNIITVKDYANPTKFNQQFSNDDDKVDEPPPKQDCTVLKCTLDGHCLGWHCPFCSVNGERFRVRNHIKSVHWGSRIEMGDTWSVLCKCKNANKTTPRHWHCTFCADSTFSKSHILEKHLMHIHKVTTDVKRFSRCKLVAVNGVPLNGETAMCSTVTEEDGQLSLIPENVDLVIPNENVVVHEEQPIGEDEQPTVSEEILKFTCAWKLLEEIAEN